VLVRPELRIPSRNHPCQAERGLIGVIAEWLWFSIRRPRFGSVGVLHVWQSNCYTNFITDNYNNLVTSRCNAVVASDHPQAMAIRLIVWLLWSSLVSRSYEARFLDLVLSSATLYNAATSMQTSASVLEAVELISQRSCCGLPKSTAVRTSVLTDLADNTL
jgi:hypothetical protein